VYKKLAQLQEKIRGLPLWVCGLNSLIDRHRQVEQEFHDLLRTLLPGGTSLIYQPGTLKNLGRIWTKALVEEAGQLHNIDDIIRGAFTADNFKDLKQIDELLEDFAKTYNITYERRDKFAKEPEKTGVFRSIMYKFDFGNHIQAEVQLNIKAFADIYPESHNNYETIRELERKSELSSDEKNQYENAAARNQELHRAAWQSVRAEYAAIYGKSPAAAGTPDN
jgi:hypothetical protein